MLSVLYYRQPVLFLYFVIFLAFYNAVKGREWRKNVISSQSQKLMSETEYFAGYFSVTLINEISFYFFPEFHCTTPPPSSRRIEQLLCSRIGEMSANMASAKQQWNE